MDVLLAAIKTDLETNVTYLRGVNVIDDELAPPVELGFPQVGLKDGDEDSQPKEYQKGTETLRVRVTTYQSVILKEPGASIMGEASLGDQGKGLIAIGKDIKTRLHKNKLGLAGYFLARLRSAEASRTLIAEEAGAIVQARTQIFEYARSVTE